MTPFSDEKTIRLQKALQEAMAPLERRLQAVEAGLKQTQKNQEELMLLLTTGHESTKEK
ncbi:hypothetical protein [Marinococcus halotolerans]|jgi:hypothetical protein|uniref:hypothetical protein n=1 Tax=Marinococcus halotolerans TaxID=301092 RepID=UPI0003B569A4|nr:hypothetical protein [Marinococcus halotolerans]